MTPDAMGLKYTTSPPLALYTKFLFGVIEINSKLPLPSSLKEKLLFKKFNLLNVPVVAIRPKGKFVAVFL